MDTAAAGACEEWQALKRKVSTEFQLRGGERHANIALHAKVILLTLAIGAGYSSILFMPPSLLWLAIWAAVGITSFFLLVNCAHDASHQVLFTSRRANRAALCFSFLLFGVDGELWGLRHLHAHHPRTNIAEEDPDSVANPYLRLSPHHPWRPWFKYQRFYAIFLYAFALLHTAWVQDFDHVINRPLPYLKRVNQRKALLRLLVVKIVYLGIFLVLPALIAGIPVAWLLLGIAVKSTAASLVFVSTIALNHYVMETTFYPEDTVQAEETYLLHHLKSSLDWHPQSRFVCGLMGGANAHVAHHLFPYLSHRHYHWVSKIIEEYCTERALPYHRLSFAAGVRSHYRFLTEMGRRPA